MYKSENSGPGPSALHRAGGTYCLPRVTRERVECLLLTMRRNLAQGPVTQPDQNHGTFSS